MGNFRFFVARKNKIPITITWNFLIMEPIEFQRWISPGAECHWILAPFFSIGTQPSTYPTKPEGDIVLFPNASDGLIARVIQLVCLAISNSIEPNSGLRNSAYLTPDYDKLIEQAKKCPHIHIQPDTRSIQSHSGYENISVVATCVIIRKLGLSLEAALDYVGSCIYPVVVDRSKVTAVVKRYLPPISVIMCGDLLSSLEFEDVITMELEDLPLYSTIILQGRPGVEKYVEKLIVDGPPRALRILKITSYGKLWSDAYLDTQSFRPTLALIFHPDIEAAGELKIEVMDLWKKNVKIYVHDLKRKSKFDGDFTVL